MTEHLPDPPQLHAVSSGPQVGPAPRVLVTGEEAAVVLAMTERQFRERHRERKVPPPRFKAGRSQLWSVQELLAWADLGCPHRDDWVDMWETISRRKHVG